MRVIALNDRPESCNKARQYNVAVRRAYGRPAYVIGVRDVPIRIVYRVIYVGCASARQVKVAVCRRVHIAPGPRHNQRLHWRGCMHKHRLVPGCRLHIRILKELVELVSTQRPDGTYALCTLARTCQVDTAERQRTSVEAGYRPAIGCKCAYSKAGYRPAVGRQRTHISCYSRKVGYCGGG